MPPCRENVDEAERDAAELLTEEALAFLDYSGMEIFLRRPPVQPGGEPELVSVSPRAFSRMDAAPMPDVPTKIEQRYLDVVQAACSGKVYYYQTEEEALADGVDAEVLFVWGGNGKMPEAWCGTSKRLKWINSFSAGVNPIMDGPISDLPVRLTNAKGIHGRTKLLLHLRNCKNCVKVSHNEIKWRV